MFNEEDNRSNTSKYSSNSSNQTYSCRLMRDKNNPFNFEEPWSKAGEQLLLDIAKKAAQFEAIHTEAAYRFKKAALIYTIPTVFLPLILVTYSSIIATYNADGPGYRVPDIVGNTIIGLCAAYLGLRGFIEQREKNFHYATDCKIFSGGILSVLHGIGREYRIQYDVYLSQTLTTWANLLDKQPTLPKDLDDKVSSIKLDENVFKLISLHTGHKNSLQIKIHEHKSRSHKNHAHRGNRKNKDVIELASLEPDKPPAILSRYNNKKKILPGYTLSPHDQAQQTDDDKKEQKALLEDPSQTNNSSSENNFLVNDSTPRSNAPRNG